MIRYYAIDKIVSATQEQLAGYDIVALTFAGAYAELRRAAPTGDLHIHLSVIVDLGERDEHGVLQTASDR